MANPNYIFDFLHCKMKASYIVLYQKSYKSGSQSNWTGRIKLRRYAIMNCLTPFSLCDHKVLNINASFNTT